MAVGNDEYGINVISGDIQVDLISELYEVLTPQTLMELASQYKASHAAAQPFPHNAIDDIFPRRFLEEVDGCHEDRHACHNKNES